MDMLSNLLGGQQQQQELQDFTQRYEQGSPWDGISDDEAVSRYSQLAPHLSPDDYEASARDAFSRLDPSQRAELGRYVQQRAPEYGFQLPDATDDDDRLQDPGYLAQMTGGLHRQQPGILGQILGGGGGGGLGGMLGGGGGGGGLGGMLGGGSSQGGGMLSSPIAKAALGGIAAMAAQRFMNRR